MRIQDKTLITVSLIISSIGIIGLSIISTTNTTVTMTAAQTVPEETVVTLNTTIVSVTHRGNTTFLELQEQCILPAIAFEHIELTPPQRAIITGTITFNEGERELIIERMTNP